MINPFKKTYSAKEMALFNFLQKVKPFKRLNFSEMAHFVPYLYLRTYKKDEVVFFRGDPANALYIIKKGKISLSLDIKDRVETLKICRKGEEFGDMAMVEKTKRIYTAVCESENAELFVVPKVNLLEIFEDQKVIKGKMLMSLAEEYHQLTSNLFSAYRSSLGFFNLGQIFVDPAEQDDDELI